jgi:hypothetical protein
MLIKTCLSVFLLLPLAPVYRDSLAMLRQFSKSVSLRYIIFCFVASVSSCRDDKKSVDVSQVDVTVRADRFEKDLAENVQNISFLASKYGSFFELYTYQLLKMGTPDTALLQTRLSDFVHDPDITSIYSDARQVFADFSDVDAALTDAFRHYRYHFPGKIIPRVITYISGFTYAVVCADSTLGIGLDMYLGSNSKYYPSLQLPEYKIQKMERAYIAADAMRGWAQSEWEQDAAQTDLLSQMIYQGKIQYFLDLMLPVADDTVKFGYTQKQLAWCTASEKSIWSFLVDNKLLFSSESKQVGKFVNDGPTTNGFPKESPGNIGAWIGFRIVDAYMGKQQGISPAQLMADNDYKKIFRDAGYKPAK